MALCLALDAFGVRALADSPRIGAQLRTKENSVVVSKLDRQSVLQRSGVRPGDVVLSIAGRPVTPAAFIDEPEDYASRLNHDTFWEWQRFAMASTTGKNLEIVFRSGRGKHIASSPVQPLGWKEAWVRSSALRLVGWVFLLVSFLIWTKKRSEASLVNFLGGIGVFASLCTTAVYLPRDFCLPTKAFVVLVSVNYAATLTAILTVYLGWVFPSPVPWLAKRPWVRVIPFAVCGVVLVLHFVRFFFLPPQILYILISLSLLGFMLTVVLRLVRATDPLLKSQLLWVALGGIGGFLPWVLLSAIPAALGMAPISSNISLLSAITTPVCLSFAIFRYRLLDVDRIFDWVLVHAIALGAFSIVELGVWHWLGSRYAPQAVSKPFLIGVSIFLVVFLYAPLRGWLLRLLTALSGNTYPSLTDSLGKLLERAHATGDPGDALEQTLRWTFNPAKLSWIRPGQAHQALLEQLASVQDGMLGYEFGDACPEHMESAAWIPVQTAQELAALVLWPNGSRGWTREDLKIARTLVRSGEPLFKMQNMQREHHKAEAGMREQREEMVREMHDGLGSQLFGASLLTNVSQGVSSQVLHKRMADTNAALIEAMDSLRTGLTVLGSPPGAFGPAVLALLLRGERVLDAAGIALETQVDDEAVSLQLDSRLVFGLLRAMQEGLTNIARHSGGTNAAVRILLRGSILAILIQDNGMGFIVNTDKAGHGLTNIRRRTQMLGGNATITSAPGAGCTIELEIPLKNGEIRTAMEC